MIPGVLELAIIISIAAVLGIIAKLLRQPIILAYLLTGVIISSMPSLALGESELMNLFSDLGIMFLLFLVGLEMNYASLKLVGKTSLLLGIGQMTLTFILGYVLAIVLGFNLVSASYIAIAITFSSTIISVKLLTDKDDLHSLYGKISVGVLLAQDVVAILLLLFLAGLQSGAKVNVVDFSFTLGMNIILFIAILILSRYVFPRMFDKIAKSRELLFLVSIAWVFLMAGVITRIGLSIEVAGFLAGLALANSSEHFQIASYVRPLRDFFLLIFFVILGTKFTFFNWGSLIWPVVIFSLFVLIIKPLIVMGIMGLIGHRRRPGFMTGAVLAQISEFSLILCAVAIKLGHAENSILGVVTMVAIITIVVSNYFSHHADYLFKKIGKTLKVFERKRARAENIADEIPARPIILIGYHRTGRSIMNNLKKDKVLVVDFNPEVIHSAKRQGIGSLLGDISDPEVFQLAHAKDAELIISTTPDLKDSLLLLNYVKQLKKRPKVIVRADSEENTRPLYSASADYVLVPLLSVGDYLGKTLTLPRWEQTLEKLKTRDMALMNRINRY